MSSLGRVLLSATSGLLGVMFSVACIKIDESLKLLPRLPSPGGEDDFAARAAIFAAVVGTTFLVLGVALGWLAYRDPRRAALGWTGAIIGSATAFLLAPMSFAALSRLHVNSGNSTFLAFSLIWTSLAVIVAVLFVRAAGHAHVTHHGDGDPPGA